MRSCSACNSISGATGADRRDHRARLPAAERGQTVETKLERAAMHAAEHAGNLVRQRVVDIADEAQREVIIFGIDPAGARQTAAHHGERLGDRAAEFQDR